MTRRQSTLTGSWPFRGLALALTFLVLVPPARAQTPPTVPEREDAPSTAENAPPAPRDDGRRTWKRLPANLLRTTIGVFHRDNLPALAAGGAAIGIASIWDQEARDAARPSGLGESLQTVAGGVWSSVFVTTMFAVGRISHPTRFRAMTYDWLDAAVVNFAYTEVLKAAAGRTRPSGEDNKSFPSGHASNAFALATVVQRHYGWEAGMPAYLAASIVGASRVSQDKHYLSDVVAGAAVGWIVGRSVVRVNNQAAPNSGAVSLDIRPMLGRHERGLQVALSF